MGTSVFVALNSHSFTVFVTPARNSFGAGATSGAYSASNVTVGSATMLLRVWKT